MLTLSFRKPLLALLLLAAVPAARAQNVGIGTTAPAASAALDVSSTARGLLPPRMSQTQRDLIGSPATGLLVFNTTTNKLNTWNGTSWEAALSATEQPVQNPTVTFNYTGGVQTYTVPPGVTSLRIDARAAGGGELLPNNIGGKGARVQATLSVTPGQVLQIQVGGAGYVDTGGNAANGGYNGGGLGLGGSGGGATDIRTSGGTLADRLLVAGGGGGSRNQTGAIGGDGGGLTGANGYYTTTVTATGGTQAAGGSTGGSLGTGGSGSFTTGGGGGGGGYYGGGGGGYYGGGGGGSSWVTLTGGSAITYTAGANTGNGSLAIAPNVLYAAPALDGSNFVNVPGDNLGNHTATQNLNLGTNQLVGNGGSSGLAVSSTGSVGIGTTTPAASAVLDVSSTARGLLPPRMSQTQRDAIASPAAGLTLYNSSTGKLNTWNGTAWTEALSTTEQPYQNPAVTFSYTGGPQTYTVPAGVYSLGVDVAGAQGGSSGNGNTGGPGARAQATLTVTPGETLTLYVGGAGSTAPFAAGGAGYNGGGNGGYSSGNRGSGGGGASDVRRSATAPSTALAERLLVAAGGAGAGTYGVGGAGGAPNGANGGAAAGTTAGTGATQSAGGSVGGGLGQGGAAPASLDGGGGGGGYYGGGGSSYLAGGGGGSSWAAAAGSSGLVLTGGYRTGNGLIVLTPSPAYAAPVLDGTNFVNVPGTWSVNGADVYRPTGRVGIGTSSPAGLLSVQGSVLGAGVPDVQQLTAGSGSGGTDQWQSFTATASGSLTQLDMRVSSPTGANGAPGTLSIYAGQGTGGTLLTTQAIGYNNLVATYQQYPLGTPVAVVAGQQYTYRFQTPSINNGFVGLSTTNPYAGGQSSLNATWDFCFKTYVAPTLVTDVLTALTGGNVGIGTTTPGYRLDVAGNANVTGNGYVSGNVGIGTTAPTQKLEVAGQVFSSTGGFRFPDNTIQTTAASITADNGLTKTGNNIALGGTLTGATTLAQAGNAFSLTGGNVGIGTSSPGYTLDVAGNANVTGNSYVSGSVGIGTSSPATTLDVRTAAGAAITVGSTANTAGALYLGNSGHGLKRNYNNTNDVGLYTTAANLFLSAAGPVTSQFVLLNNGDVGIGMAPGYKLDVAGLIRGTNVSPSDARFKTNVRPIGSALASVLALRGVRYDWNALGVQHGGTAGAGQVGLIAQEVERIYPELVHTDALGYKAVNYAQLTPVLIEALKELKADNDALKARATATEAGAAADHADLQTLKQQLARLLGEQPTAGHPSAR